MKFIFSIVDSKLIQTPPTSSPLSSAGSAIHNGAQWVGGAVGNGINGAVSQFFSGLGHSILHGLILGWHSMPMILTVVGLGCFLLTIAAGNGKIYGWGITAWAAAAIIQVMSHG